MTRGTAAQTRMVSAAEFWRSQFLSSNPLSPARQCGAPGRRLIVPSGMPVQIPARFPELEDAWAETVPTILLSLAPLSRGFFLGRHSQT